MLTGTATPGAIITARLRAGGQEVTVTTTASASGSWSLTPHTLQGTIAVDLEQSYRDAASQTVVVAGPTGVVFSVGQLVAGYVQADTESTSSLVLSGPAGASIEAVSPVPGISSTYLLDASGATAIPMPVAKADAGPVRFRLVSGGRTGPWAVWS